MKRCVGDRTLWLMSEGEAGPEARAHVASCVACRERLQRLERDLRQLRSVLTAPPPPRIAPAHLRPVSVPWLTAALAFAALLIVIWVGPWWQPPVPPTLPMEAGQESIWPFIERVSEAIFAIVEVGAVEIPDLPYDLTDLQAALAGDWPCEEPDTSWHLECDDDVWPFLLSEN
jgi:hypothetical protein